MRQVIYTGYGSPPQVRGKPRVSVTRGAKPGITPAGAGKTTCIRFLWAGGWDHPRRCGENGRFYLHSSSSLGSPPQVRGKLFSCCCGRLGHRITPAGAGKTKQEKTQPSYKQDHPRRCGENPYHADSLKQRLGSPPQVRGKL